MNCLGYSLNMYEFSMRYLNAFIDNLLNKGWWSLILFRLKCARGSPTAVCYSNVSMSAFTFLSATSNSWWAPFSCTCSDLRLLLTDLFVV
jgi:hypothetical protein